MVTYTLGGLVGIQDQVSQTDTIYILGSGDSYYNDLGDSFSSGGFISQPKPRA